MRGKQRERKGRSHLFAAQVLPGLEQVAGQEIRERLAGALWVAEAKELLLFRWGGNPSALLELRTTEDVFAVVDYSDKVGPAYRDLRAYANRLRSRRGWGGVAELHRRARPGKVKRTTFRVVAQMWGRHGFRRVDIQRAVEDVVAARFPRWKWVRDEAHLEVWVHLQSKLVMVSVRLSDRTMRHRRYKSAHLPASLRPTMAAAMVFLSRPQPNDRFCDPMCGAGTILIERAMADQYAGLWGGDRDATAVAATKANVGTRHQPLALHLWDGGRLPLADASLNRVVTNLPFGRQISTPEANRRLYGLFFKEMARVLQVGGRAVLLTSQHDLVRRGLDRHPEMRQVQAVQVEVLGQPACIYVLVRVL